MDIKDQFRHQQYQRLMNVSKRGFKPVGSNSICYKGWKSCSYEIKNSTGMSEEEIVDFQSKLDTFKPVPKYNVESIDSDGKVTWGYVSMFTKFERHGSTVVKTGYENAIAQLLPDVNEIQFTYFVFNDSTIPESGKSITVMMTKTDIDENAD